MLDYESGSFTPAPLNKKITGFYERIGNNVKITIFNHNKVNHLIQGLPFKRVIKQK